MCFILNHTNLSQFPVISNFVHSPPYKVHISVVQLKEPMLYFHFPFQIYFASWTCVKAKGKKDLKKNILINHNFSELIDTITNCNLQCITKTTKYMFRKHKLFCPTSIIHYIFTNFLLFHTWFSP